MNRTQAKRAMETLEDVFYGSDAVVISGTRFSTRKGKVGVIVCGHQSYNLDVWAPLADLVAKEDL